MAVGRYPKEVVAAAILVEKMAKTEVLGSALGKIHYINPLLTKIMHLVYKKRYSRREREAYMSRLDEGRKELFEYALKLSETKLVSEHGVTYHFGFVINII